MIVLSFYRWDVGVRWLEFGDGLLQILFALFSVHKRKLKKLLTLGVWHVFIKAALKTALKLNSAALKKTSGNGKG